MSDTLRASQLAYFLTNEPYSLLDEDLRPLGEHTITSLYKAAGVDERPCPYDDRRGLTGKPINAAALRQVSRCWPQVIGQLKRVAQLLFGDRSRCLTGHEMWRVHLVAFAGAALWRLSSTAPVPRPLSALFKTSLGYTTILPTLLLCQPETSDALLCDQIPAADFFALADEQHWLVGQYQVCAGSAAFIQKSYLAMGYSGQALEPEHQVFEREDLGGLAIHLANVWVTFLWAAVTVRDLLGSGHFDEVPGFHSMPRHLQEPHLWPFCAQLFSQADATRHFSLPRALPALQLSHIQRLIQPDQVSSLHKKIVAGHRPQDLRQVDEVLAHCVTQLSLHLFDCVPPAQSLAKSLALRPKT